MLQQDKTWQAVLGEIELSVSSGNYLTWFKNTRLLRYKDGEAVIGVANVFIKQQLEKRFVDLVKQVLAKNGVEAKTVTFKTHSSITIPKQTEQESENILHNPSTRQQRPQRAQSAARSTNQFGSTQPNTTTSSLTHTYRQGLNSKYTFENFIVGSGNELAYAACQAIAQNPGTKYNPLFVYGGVGIGKTHLIQAVGNAILANRPSAHIVYISTEQFVQEFLDAIRYKKNTDFAGFYRSADVLIVDDIQFIAGKEKTQDEFFHTFNALHQANKQIILSSDKPPTDIPTLEDRLRSRFAWGMAIDMQIPDFETRCAIIQTKATSLGNPLEPEVVDYLANLIKTNIRELEGALNQLIAHCELQNVEPDVAIATALLGSGRNRPKHLSAKHIIERTAKYFQISIDEILGPKRDKDIVLPRQVAMYMLREELHISFPKIAKELGRKDHTTAMHSVEKITKEAALDPQIKEAILEIKGRIYA